MKVVPARAPDDVTSKALDQYEHALSIGLKKSTKICIMIL